MYDQIILRGENGSNGRGDVTVLAAPEFSAISPALLAEIALWRSNSSFLYVSTGLAIVGIGTDGKGLGVVRYRIGAYDPDHQMYPLARVS